ncbi:hypothetical protein [Rubripirellula reticaptiva]|uniref:Uncharacterized protein n=1 Tax=Rubripirellula reticaptiva TaxID=2528013 RepID=A0A5C6EC10_9BACT|nr:hypothetical protein [Rubripirellula reticaptiva]TWU46532.1 hypothetical protein Poly59_55050 [Rubripirellula reticaptiva]
MSKADFYTEDDMSTWERIKKAFANDWEQTKADFGSDSARDMDQDVDDTFKQMAGSDDAFENREQAFRFGYTAQQRYGSDHPKWSNDVDTRLRSEYDGDYDADRRYIQHAYGYRTKS